MAMVQCENRHFFDDSKHTHCPHCPVPGLKDVKIPGTQAAPISRPAVPQTEPASARGAAAPVRGSSDRAGAAGVTVGIFQKQQHFEPVVGWLVCIKGPNKGRDYRLHSDVNKLGRAPNMDVCIEGDETISRENHCQIAYSSRSKTFSIVPADARNLIYLNDKDVLQATRLAAYNRIDLGESTFLFVPLCNDQFDWETLTERPQRSEQPAKTPGKIDEPPVV